MVEETDIDKDAEKITENLKGVGFTGSKELGSAVEEISTEEEELGLLDKLMETFRGLLNPSKKPQDDK